MKKTTFVFSIFFVLFIASLFILRNLEDIALEHGNGAVINIWIDNLSRFDTLKNHNVRYLFVDVGETGKDGRIKTPENEITGFLDFVNKYETANNYDFILLPYSEVIVGDYNITSEDFENNFVDDYVKLNAFGFDGILVDIEAIPFDERQNYLNLLETLRAKLPQKSIISVYAGALSDSPNKWEWDPAFYKSVSDRVDLVSASGYDSDIANTEEYRNYIKNQVGAIASSNFKSKFLFAVPTHKEPPETLENALLAYTEELEKHTQNSFIGVCIFAEWTADPEEWGIFEKYIKD